jgi:hypothetical protein
MENKVRDLALKESGQVSGAGDVLIDYVIGVDECEDGDKILSVFLQFKGLEEDIMIAVDRIFA